MKHSKKTIVLLFCLTLLFLCCGSFSLTGEASRSSASKKLRNTLSWEKGKLYYYDSNGKKVKKCWKKIDGNTYCFRADGSARTGWHTKKGKTYFFSRKNCSMITGWRTIDGKRYYFNQNGVMQTDYWINGKYVAKNGVWQKNKKMKITALEKKLRSYISSRRGSWSVYVKNLDTGESFSINNRRVYAASLIKLYAMSAAYERIEQGRFSKASVQSQLRSMITVSSNDAFNSIVRKIGTSYINSWCRANGYKNTSQGHGLSPSGNNYGLSNGSGSNVTSVVDCGRLLESMYRGTCVSKKASAEMIRLLKQQQRRWKIPAGVPSGVTVANKTGETNNTTHDAAIVYSKGADYILCVMGNVPGGAWSAASSITRISKITYDFFN